MPADAPTAADPAVPPTPSLTGPLAPTDEPTTAGPSPPADAPDAPPGYDLLDEVGRGGMGVIVRARDRAVGRDVAVKLLHDRYPAAGPAARRFVDEARITGQLQHPGVPAVYQIGTTPAGRPFLAMKLVKGQTLADLLRANPDRGRLVAVFEGICQAVGYAHAHGVIHRDLKPANVMVGAFGEVQVMDWGLAKLLGQPTDPTDPDATTGGTEIQSLRAEGDRTQDGQALGTPAYMPPEQAVGAVADMDRRSDVFGLGAVLCHLLTGLPPYVGADAGSTRQLAAQAKLADAFGRLGRCGAEPDLIGLCKRCLSPERSDRPADAGTVAAAVAALRSAADDRARQAEVDAAEGRVHDAEGRKRRRLLATAGGLVLAVTLAGGVAAGVLWRRAVGQEAATATALADKTTESERAERNFAQAEANLLQANMVLNERNAERVRTVAALRKLTDARNIGNITIQGNKKYIQEVLDIWQAVATSRGDEQETLELRAEGLKQVAVMLHVLQKYEDSEAAVQAALAIEKKLVSNFSSRSDYRQNLARTLSTLAARYADKNIRTLDAEAILRAVVAMQESLVVDYPARPEFREDLVRTYNQLYILMESSGRGVEAETTYRDELAVRTKLASDFRSRPDLRQGLAHGYIKLSNIIQKNGRSPEADTVTRSALEILEKLATEFPSQPEYRVELANTHVRFGFDFSVDGRIEEAESAYRNALAVWKALIV